MMKKRKGVSKTKTVLTLWELEEYKTEVEGRGENELNSGSIWKEEEEEEEV